MTWFTGDTREVIVQPGTQYYDPLDCPNRLNSDGVCMVSISAYVEAFFGFKWSTDHNTQNILILGLGWLLCVRLLTFVALRCLTYSGK